MTAKTRKQQIEEMLADDPTDPFLHYGLAMEYVSNGEDENGVRCLRELVAMAPDYVAAYMQAGQALVRLGRPEEARQMLDQGSQAARRQGDQHAWEEMQGMMAGLER